MTDEPNAEGVISEHTNLDVDALLSMALRGALSRLRLNAVSAALKEAREDLDHDEEIFAAKMKRMTELEARCAELEEEKRSARNAVANTASLVAATSPVITVRGGSETKKAVHADSYVMLLQISSLLQR